MSNISKIKKDIELNDDIDDSIKESIKETFGNMLEFLDKKNFLRWVRKQEISKVARQTIYKICTGEEDSYLKEHKEVRGYHTSPENSTDGKRKIVLRRDVPEGRDVRSHETWHAFANGLGGFSRFFGEGITEYLNQHMYKRGSSAYYKNVKVVELMNAMYGTGIIRDYLMKQGKVFFNKLAEQIDGVNILSEGNLFTSTTLIDLRTMEGFFECYHNAYYTDSSTVSKKEGDEFFDKGLGVLMDTYFAFERTQIDKMGNYKNGKIDFEKFNERLARVREKAVFLGYPEARFYTQYEELVEDLVENGHLLYGLTDGEKWARKNYITTTIEQQFDKYVETGELDEIDQENDPVFQEANQHTEFKLMKQKLKSENFIEGAGTLDEAFNYIKYFDFLTIIKERTGMSDDYFNVMISQISMDLSDSPEKFADITRSVSEKYIEIKSELRKMAANHALIETTKPLFTEGTKTAYGIKKDNEYHILVFDRNTGEIENVDLAEGGKTSIGKIKKVKEYDEKMPWEINEEVISEGLTFEIDGFGKKGNKAYISIDQGVEEVLFINGEDRVGQTLENGFDEIKNSVISQLAFGKVLDSAMQEKYSDKPKGKILYEKLIDDYYDISNVMAADVGAELLEQAIGSAVEATYPREDIQSEDKKDGELKYIFIKRGMVKSIRRIGRIAGQKTELTEGNKKTYKKMKAKIDDNQKELGILVGTREKSDTISTEESLDMITDIVDESKRKTAMSELIAAVNEMEKVEKQEEIQK